MEKNYIDKKKPIAFCNAFKFLPRICKFLVPLLSFNSFTTNTLIYRNFSTETCSDPSRYTNARVSGSEFYNGKEVEFVCPKNYVLIPKESRKLNCEKGSWKGIIPSCKGTRYMSFYVWLSAISFLYCKTYTAWVHFSFFLSYITRSSQH